jgi:CubicO group peptidase (beta-lactamase class C family)
MRNKWLWLTIIGAAVALGIVALLMPSKLKSAIDAYRDDGYAGVYHRVQDFVGIPNVRWETAKSEDVGLSSERLEKFRVSLAARETKSILVARQGRIVLEWYADDFGPNQKWGLAAAAKGVVGGVILLAALSDGKLGLDDRVAEYVPSWQQDPRRSKITIRHLASHSSGIDDVSFEGGQGGWKEYYLQNEGQRFWLALGRAPILFEPGTQFSYAGVGYYVLAYTLGTVLKRSSEPSDLRSYLRDRVMQPLGIPSNAWTLSYGHAYEVDGMTLYAIGSGASYTTRAVARVGELFLENGEWNGRRLIDATWVRQALSYANSPPIPAVGGTDPPAGLGWWVNSQGFFDALPRDAAITMGNGHEIVLVVPSLELVAVRLGKALGQPGDDYWQAAEEQFFEPLMRALAADQ